MSSEKKYTSRDVKLSPLFNVPTTVVSIILGFLPTKYYFRFTLSVSSSLRSFIVNAPCITSHPGLQPDGKARLNPFSNNLSSILALRPIKLGYTLRDNTLPPPRIWMNTQLQHLNLVVFTNTVSMSEWHDITRLNQLTHLSIWSRTEYPSFPLSSFPNLEHLEFGQMCVTKLNELTTTNLRSLILPDARETKTNDSWSLLLNNPSSRLSLSQLRSLTVKNPAVSVPLPLLMSATPLLEHFDFYFPFDNLDISSYTHKWQHLTWLKFALFDNDMDKTASFIRLFYDTLSHLFLLVSAGTKLGSEHLRRLLSSSSINTSKLIDFDFPNLSVYRDSIEIMCEYKWPLLQSFDHSSRVNFTELGDSLLAMPSLRKLPFSDGVLADHFSWSRHSSNGWYHSLRDLTLGEVSYELMLTIHKLFPFLTRLRIKKVRLVSPLIPGDKFPHLIDVWLNELKNLELLTLSYIPVSAGERVLKRLAECARPGHCLSPSSLKEVSIGIISAQKSYESKLKSLRDRGVSVHVFSH